MYLILCCSLGVLIIDCSTLTDARSRGGHSIHRLHTWHIHRIHSFSYRQLSHLNFDSLLVFHLLHLLQPDRFILFSLLFVDLLLERLPHGMLLLFSLVLHNSFLVSTLGENVTVPLELKIHSVFKYASSGLDIWEVLLGDAGVEVLVFVRVTTLSCILRNIKSFIIEFIGIVLIISSISWQHRWVTLRHGQLRMWLSLSLKLRLVLLLLSSSWLISKGGGLCLPPLCFSPLVISLLDLPLELFLISPLLEFLLENLSLVTYRRCLIAQRSYDSQLVLISVHISINGRRWIHH